MAYALSTGLLFLYMGDIKRRVIMRGIILSASIVLSGCLGPRIDIGPAKRITIKTEAREPYAISASAYEQNGDLVLIGRVREAPYYYMNGRGHVDIKVVDPQGNTFSSLAPLRSIMSRPGSFRTTIPVVMPAGSTVIIEYKPEPHQDKPS
jgi:hypothetical protein